MDIFTIVTEIPTVEKNQAGNGDQRVLRGMQPPCKGGQDVDGTKAKGAEGGKPAYMSTAHKWGKC
jgi:hypothetical protein